MFTVYECYDRSGKLLYIGVTIHLTKRLGQHRKASAWYGDVERVVTTEYATAAAAATAERDGIRDRQPMHNRSRHARPSSGWISTVANKTSEVAFSLRFPDDLYHELHARAKREGRTLHRQILHLLRREIAQQATDASKD